MLLGFGMSPLLAFAPKYHSFHFAQMVWDMDFLPHLPTKTIQAMTVQFVATFLMDPQESLLATINWHLSGWTMWLPDYRIYGNIFFQGILCVCRKGDEMGELTKHELARQHKWVNFPCWTSLLTFNKDHFGKPYRQKRPSRDWTDSAISEHSSHGYFVHGFELLFTSYLLNNFCNPALPLAC